MYGAVETNPLVEKYEVCPIRVDWSHPDLESVVRLRLVSDPGFPAWDVTYCHGKLKDGRIVHVLLPFNQLPRKGMRRAIVKHAQKCGVFAKKLRIFDNISTLV